MSASEIKSAATGFPPKIASDLDSDGRHHVKVVITGLTDTDGGELVLVSGNPGGPAAVPVELSVESVAEIVNELRTQSGLLRRLCQSLGAPPIPLDE